MRRKRFHVITYNKKYKFRNGYYRTNNLLFILWIRIKTFFKNENDLKKGWNR